jgi:hypothetical protein
MAGVEFFNEDVGPHGFRDGEYDGDNHSTDDPSPFPRQDHSPASVNNLHLASDCDASAIAQHHTLGSRPQQSSPGNHIHDGGTSKQIPGLIYAGAATPWFFHSSALAVDLGGGFIGVRFPHGASFTPVGATVTSFDGVSVSGSYDFQVESTDATNVVCSVTTVSGGAVTVGTGLECFGVAWKVHNHA